MPLSLRTTVRVSDDVMFRDLDGEAILLDLAGEAYFGLNEVGTCMWHAATSGGTLGDAVQSLLPQFDVDEATLTRDMLALFEDLVSRGLVTTTG